ncbi:MAG: hypothetical protein GY751_17730 [Bacteroidetes bacterium]|nr:hypothetical protein [Bacteroidota bacterium]
MTDTKTNYSIIAGLFTYPDKELSTTISEVQSYLDRHIPSVSDTLRPFTDCMVKLDLLEQQDLYLRSFEVQAVTTLDIGYVVFGDDYKRGELLVNLNREHAEAGLDCGIELADHLTNVLRLMDALADEVVLRDLVKKVIAPALRKMRDGFEPAQLEAKEKVYKRHHKTLLDKHNSFTIYKYALQTLYDVLSEDFDTTEEAFREKSGGFLSSIKQEINIES